VCGVLVLSAACVGVYFFYALAPHQALTWQLSLIGFAWCCSAFFAWQFVHSLKQGELDFDGVHWYVAEKIGTVSVRFDGQACLLLRFEDDLNHAEWLWLDQRFAPHHWLDLRRAVYSRPALQNSPDSL
jgi:hypothetical protein